MNQLFHNRSRAGRRQQGFTMVEVMVAVVIALFMLAGLFLLVSNTRQTFGTQNQLAQLQDNERLAMAMITDVIQAAGYFPIPAPSPTGPKWYTSATALLAASAPQFAQDGQAITGSYAPGAPGDSISVRYLTATGDGVINCTGGTNTTAGLQAFVNVFSVDTSNNLVCSMNGSSQQLIGGVQSLSFLYGIDNDGDGSVDAYLNASAMTTANWSQVISVKVTLTLLNPLYAPGQAGQPQTIPFTRVVSVMNRS